MTNGLTQLTSAQIQQRIHRQRLFGAEDLLEYLFTFCKMCLTAQDEQLDDFSYLGINPSVLLYGIPNTGKTTLCYLLFDQLKQEVTNQINFYTLDVGRMLDPSLGQSSRNIEDTFTELKSKSRSDSSVFLLLDELDAFCMSRQKKEEHDAIRRAMTTLMLELDKLQPDKNNKFLIFGITNVPELIDSAVVRRFSLKTDMQYTLNLDEFQDYLNYLSNIVKYTLSRKDIKKLYKIYEKRKFTAGDIKSIYKELYVDLQHKRMDSEVIHRKIFDLFKDGFSTYEHLTKNKKGLSL